MAGAELRLGVLDGNLEHNDPDEPIRITYKNNTQFGYGLTAGVIFGRQDKNLLLIYINETTRKFDVTLVDEFGPYYQKDEQGMLKYGIGFERLIWKKVNARLTAGMLSVDFGDRMTNINVEDKIDLMAGVVFQL
jgi:hypothetical protein